MAIQDHARKIAEALGPFSGPDADGNYTCRCPAHDDEHPSFSIKDRDGGGLLVHCFAGCAAGDIYAALRREGLLSGDINGAEVEVTSEIEVDPDAAVDAREQARAKKLAEAKVRFQRFWRGLDPASAIGSRVDDYCNWRGVEPFKTAPAWLRFTPKGLHKTKVKGEPDFDQFFPMLVTLATDPKTGEETGAQRTYLAYREPGFAPVDKGSRKKTTDGCSILGSVCRMAEPIADKPLLIGEGWESVKTAMDATGLPGWAVFGVSGLKRFDPPEGVGWIIFLAENDEKGQNAKALAEALPRLFERGLKIGVAYPPAGVNDFNDLVRLRGDKTRLHDSIEAGRKIVLDIVKDAARASRSKADAKGEDSGGKLPGLDPDDDDAEKGGRGKGKDKLTMEAGGLYCGKLFVCPPFKVIALSRDDKADNWGLHIRFRNFDGAEREETIPSGALCTDPGAIAGRLRSIGLWVNPLPAAKTALIAYLGRAMTDARVLIAKRTGWLTVKGEPVFVLPTQTIGASGETVKLSGEATAAAYAQSGTLAEWRERIAKPAGEHRLLKFAISAALAGPLLKLAGGESGGFHLYGDSTRGKTLAARIAASCWGKGSREDEDGFMKAWSSTANGMEAAFASTSDTALIIDELSQLAIGEAFAIVYALTGGKGKQRLSRDASAKTPRTWRVILFSTGEPPLATRIDEDRQRFGHKGPRGGTTVRVIDIPTDRAYGALDHPEGVETFAPAKFAGELERMAQSYYGVAGPAFVEGLINAKVSGEQVRQAVDAFLAAALKDVAEDGGQVRRVAARFALVAVAGALACGFGIVEWNPEALSNDALEMFRAWLGERGGAGPIEDAHILQQGRHFFEMYGESQFDNLDVPDIRALADRPAFKRAGFRKGQGKDQRWYVFPNVFSTDIFGGIDAKKAAKVLYEHGILEGGNEVSGRFDKKIRLGQDGQRGRFYVVTAAIFEGSSDVNSPDDDADSPGEET